MVQYLVVMCVGCAGRPRLMTVIVTDYSEVYSLEKADLLRALVDWPRMQAMVQELAECMQTWNEEPMPSFEYLEEELAAGRPLPQHPAYTHFTAVMQRLCSDYDAADAPEDGPPAPPASCVTLLQALGNHAAAAAEEHASRAGIHVDQLRGRMAPHSSELLADSGAPLCAPVVARTMRSMDFGHRAGGVPALLGNQASLLTEIGVRRSLDMRMTAPGTCGTYPQGRPEVTVAGFRHKHAQSDSRSAVDNSTRNSDEVWSAQQPDSGYGGIDSNSDKPVLLADQRDSGRSHVVHLGSYRTLHGSQHGAAPAVSADQRSAVDAHPPGVDDQGRHAPWGLTDGNGAETRAVPAAVPTAPSADGNHNHSNSSIPVAHDDDGSACMAVHRTVPPSQAIHLTPLTEDPDSSNILKALLAPPMAQMQSNSLALSRRRLIGDRTERTNLASTALQQVLPTGYFAMC